MKAEFRTLDGAIAVREVAEPAPDEIKVPVFVFGLGYESTELTPVRTYRRSFGEALYVEYARHEPPPPHAAEVERIAAAIEAALHLTTPNWLPYDKFKAAMADLRSLGKRYFWETGDAKKMLREREEALGEVAILRRERDTARSECARYMRQADEECKRAEGLTATVAQQMKEVLYQRVKASTESKRADMESERAERCNTRCVELLDEKVRMRERLRELMENAS